MGSQNGGHWRQVVVNSGLTVFICIISPVKCPLVYLFNVWTVRHQHSEMYCGASAEDRQIFYLFKFCHQFERVSSHGQERLPAIVFGVRVRIPIRTIFGHFTMVKWQSYQLKEKKTIIPFFLSTTQVQNHSSEKNLLEEWFFN